MNGVGVCNAAKILVAQCGVAIYNDVCQFFACVILQRYQSTVHRYGNRVVMHGCFRIEGVVTGCIGENFICFNSCIILSKDHDGKTGGKVRNGKVQDGTINGGQGNGGRIQINTGQIFQRDGRNVLAFHITAIGIETVKLQDTFDFQTAICQYQGEVKGFYRFTGFGTTFAGNRRIRNRCGFILVGQGIFLKGTKFG